MLPVHDHNARTSTQITAAMSLATILRSCNAGASGPGCSVFCSVFCPMFGSLVGSLVMEPSPGLMPRFAA